MFFENLLIFFMSFFPLVKAGIYGVLVPIEIHWYQGRVTAV